MLKNHHVVPSQKGGWDVKRENSEKASGHFDTKREAIDYARQVSRNQKTELVIHNKDGKISKKDSHGNDPCPPKDKN
ncbi:MAG: DUF2188 domain-containing protein [Candidatus Cloacimonetes bacterium]|nr:DUF2188 domain-containing protein [Candidatus Cloacimonadota bacterium]